MVWVEFVIRITTAKAFINMLYNISNNGRQRCPRCYTQELMIMNNKLYHPIYRSVPCPGAKKIGEYGNTISPKLLDS